MRAWATLVALVLAGSAHASLTRFVVEQTRDLPPARAGAPAYTWLRGHFEGRLSPADRHNIVITDLAAAARGGDGRVRYSATFEMAVPTDAKTTSGVLFYNVPNRGTGSAKADEDGHIRLVSGWQGDLTPAAGVQTASVPIATGVTGRVLARFFDIAPGTASIPITAGFYRPVARPLPLSLDSRRALLFRQASDRDRPVAIPSGQWAFADCTRTVFPGRPDGTKLCLKGGFDAGYAYTLVYTARDPKVLGIGFAATRDLVSFLRHDAHDQAGTANPIFGRIRRAVASGTSQSGNFLKSFVNLGFNADEANRIVFDGINPDIAARQVPLNIRFGVPGGAASLFEPGSEGSLWWSRYDDRVRGRGESSLLDRCRSSDTCPKVIETFGSSELWGLRMSPALVGTDAASDVPLPATVRRYYFPGVTHGGSPVGDFLPGGDQPWPGAPRCTLAWNPNPSNPTLRVLQKALVDWVLSGKTPPASVYPTRAAGDLVPPTADAMGWPAIPGAPRPDALVNIFLDYDLGRKFRYHDLSGAIGVQPPRIRRTIATLVPRVNADGNETAGIGSVQMLVPLGTYTGWNQRAAGYGQGGGCDFIGGFIPFARSRAERIAHHDPRRSLEERYGDHAGFVARIRTVAAEQVKAGWLLPDDAAAIVARAQASAVLTP